MHFSHKYILSLISALCISVCAENPLGLPEYSREYELTFRSPAEAESAVLTLSPLPKGKKVLFSCRWDDCNVRHQKTAEVMRDTGCRGTFFLWQAGPLTKKMLPDLLAAGNSIGNHTLHHLILTKLPQSKLWKEIIENRYEYEVLGNFPVTAFALPFCRWKEKDDPDAPKRIGTALRNAGMLGAPEFWRQDDGYGYPKGCFIDTALTNPGDKEPSESRFDADIQRFLKKGVPHITLGMHSWHTPAGLAALRRILKKSSDRPDWLCCNENEAIARILAARVTRVEKIRVRGSTACFRLTGPTPAALGHPAPLSGHSGDQWFELPHKLPMPTKIALFKSNVSSDKLQISPQIDLFRAALKVDPSEGSARLNIKNCGTIPAGALELTLRMPGYCKPGLQRRRIEKIEPGASESIDFRFSLSPDADGNAPAAAEIDLQYGTEIYRLWVIAEIQIKKQKENFVKK